MHSYLQKINMDIGFKTVSGKSNRVTNVPDGKSIRFDRKFYFAVIDQTLMTNL